MSSYTPNIPQPTDDPSDSQDQILQNFQSLQNIYGTSGDHYPWTNTTPIEGFKHAKVTLPGLPTTNVPGNLIPAPAAGNCAIFGITRNSQTTPFVARDGLPSPTPPDFVNLWPILPIKAFVTFTVVANAAPPQVQTINQTFNITSITRNPATTYDFVITNAMRTITYGILYFASSGPMNNQPSYAINSTTNFTITSAATHGAQVTVIVLEP